jgi:outer membrane protein OmpA-like peptidoglycan-associated protein
MLAMQGSDRAFFLTDGNYCKVLPLMKTTSYLTDNFSIEYDCYGNYSYQPIILMTTADGRSDLEVHVNHLSADWTGYNGLQDKSQTLKADLPAGIADKNFADKWHHIAIAYKNDQMKIYVDKYRVLTIPHCGGLKPANVTVQGIGDHNRPIIFKDFKVADGVQMYMLGQKFTDAKIVTHGINFDVDKSTIKPESMGTLNMIVHVLQDNPDLKFEVDGHTDNSGSAAHNLTLSKERADAVKAQLISMGIDPSRLSSKGFGDTKPMSDNSTLEEKANNRRVEFVRM